jgi:hypothetical protein
MFDPGHVGQILITLLRDPAMAEATAIASVVMSLASKKKISGATGIDYAPLFLLRNRPL